MTARARAIPAASSAPRARQLRDTMPAGMAELLGRDDVQLEVDGTNIPSQKPTDPELARTLYRKYYDMVPLPLPNPQLGRWLVLTRPGRAVRPCGSDRTGAVRLRPMGERGAEPEAHGAPLPPPCAM